MLDTTVIRHFESVVSGEVITPSDLKYASARRVYNAMIDRRPALIVCCASVSDILASVEMARLNNLGIAVRGGGHSIAGFGVCDGGLVIDLSQMKGLVVDPLRRTARAEAGITWGEFDHETSLHGLATPGGVVSTTGIAGLTLGGGVGWLVRKYGLSSDNLLSGEVITADGRLLTASPDLNQDLFWGLRGCGANFGIVASFEFRLHPVSMVLGGMVLYPLDQGRDVLRFYREFTETAPDELTVSASLMTARDGAPLLALAACYAGSLQTGETVMRPLRKFGSPVADLVRPIAYPQMQRLLDEAFPAGRRNYWKSNYVSALPDELIDILLSHAKSVPSSLSVMLIERYTGAAARVPACDTAFPHRLEQYNLHIFSVWEDSAEDEANIHWTRTVWQAAQPFSTGGIYVNFLGDEGERQVRAAFGTNYERLGILKAKYDPSNIFRSNQNVRPIPPEAPATLLGSINSSSRGEA